MASWFQDHAPGDVNTPAALRTRANGWQGSRYVGTNTGVVGPALSRPQVQPQEYALPATAPAYTGPAYVGTPANSNMGGFDAAKVNDPTLGTSHKYVGGRYLRDHPGDLAGMLQLPEFSGWTQVSGDKIRSPEGSIYDARNADGSVQWQYISGGPAGARNNGIYGDDPNGGNYLGPSGGARPGTLANPGGSTADFTVNPWTQKFVAPTQADALNDQGFQFTLARGKDALEHSAAARGTLLTTGTLKDLDQYSQGMGSQQYDKVYGRRMGEYENAYRNFTGNEQARYAAHNSNFGNNLSLNQNQFNQGLLTNQNAFNQQYSLATLGMNAATGANNNAGNYANNAGGLYQDQGNANAAAGMYGAQGWQNALSNLGNLGGYYAGLYGKQNNRNPLVNYNGPGPWADRYVY